MLNLFLKELKKRWVEYLLGILVISLVVSALAAQRSITLSADDKIHDLAHKLGKNMLVMPEKTNLSNFYTQRYEPVYMPDSYPDNIRKSPLSGHIGYIQSNLYGNVEVNGVSLVIVGSRLNDRPLVLRQPDENAADLGGEAADKLGLKKGDELKIGDISLRVNDIIDKAPDGIGVGVFTTLDTAQRILNRPGKMNAMRLGGCWCKIDIVSLAAKVERELPGVRAITVDGTLKAQTETVAVMSRFSSSIYLIGLALAGGTIITLMSSQTRRHRREIGLLLAIGASPWRINALYVLKAALMGLAGGLFGYLLGIPATSYFSKAFLELPIELSGDLLPPVLLLSSALSVFAAHFPARRAALMDPTVVLRED